MAAVACLLLVVSLFDAMTQIRSTETRGSVRELLSQPPGSGLGLDVEGVIGILRGVVLLSGALAAAGAILAVYCLRRHRGARVGLSVVAVLMLFSTTFVAGLLPVVVALAASMLWRREARDWFDGVEPRPQAAPWQQPSSGADRDPPATRATWQPQQTDQHTGQQPEDPGQQPPAPPASSHAFGTAGPGQPPGASWPPPGFAPGVTMARGARRPASVTAAAWLTWVMCGLTTMLLAMMVLTLLAQQDQLLAELRKNPEIAERDFSSDQLLGALWVFSAVGIFWSMAAMVLAALAFNRVRAGQVGLVVSAAAAAVLGVLLVVGLLHAAAAVATVVLLLRGSANRWFAGEDWSGPGPAPGSTSAPDPAQQSGPSGKPPVW